MSTLADLFNALWAGYTVINPDAKQIFNLLEKRGERVINDHIALRTFRHSNIGIDTLAQPFLDLGYQQKADYHFTQKNLYARHYEHSLDANQPKIFISELITENFSQQLQSTVDSLAEQISPAIVKDPFFISAGQLWTPTCFNTYKLLQNESEYAAWVSAFGFCANHFTVLVNALQTITSIAELNSLLKQKGFKLNTAGGEIKGSPDQYLEQSSTLASVTSAHFTDQKTDIPGCYYEFAYRYPLPNGCLYHGFVTKSADKIFESTHNTQL